MPSLTVEFGEEGKEKNVTIPPYAVGVFCCHAGRKEFVQIFGNKEKSITLSSREHYISYVSPIPSRNGAVTRPIEEQEPEKIISTYKELSDGKGAILTHRGCMGSTVKVPKGALFLLVYRYESNKKTYSMRTMAEKDMYIPIYDRRDSVSYLMYDEDHPMKNLDEIYVGDVEHFFSTGSQSLTHEQKVQKVVDEIRDGDSSLEEHDYIEEDSGMIVKFVSRKGLHKEAKWVTKEDNLFSLSNPFSMLGKWITKEGQRVKFLRSLYLTMGFEEGEKTWIFDTSYLLGESKTRFSPNGKFEVSSVFVSSHDVADNFTVCRMMSVHSDKKPSIAIIDNKTIIVNEALLVYHLIEEWAARAVW